MASGRLGMAGRWEREGRHYGIATAPAARRRGGRSGTVTGMPHERTLLLRNATVVATMDANRREIAHGWVLVRGHAIAAVGAHADVPDAADEVIDCRGMIVLPGLVNTHHHLYQTLTPAITQDSVLFDWLRDALPHLGAADAGDGDRLGSGGDGGADAVRLHHVERPSLRLSQRVQDGRRDPGGAVLGIRFTRAAAAMSLGETAQRRPAAG